jgi:hypothetical protein
MPKTEWESGVDVTKFALPGKSIAEMLEEARAHKESSMIKRKKAHVYQLWPDEFVSAPKKWLVVAAKLSKKSPWTVMIGLALWQQHRLNRGEQPLSLTGHKLDSWGIKRFYTRRALVALEKGKLIKVERFKHRSPLITIIIQK